MPTSSLLPLASLLLLLITSLVLHHRHRPPLPKAPPTPNSLHLSLLPLRFTRSNLVLDLYTFSLQVPGPTLFVSKHQATTLTFSNHMPRSNSSRTSLHFHGLHMSPMHTFDNIEREVGPSEQARYNLTLLPTHPSGTYFVHPHLHGQSAFQTAFSAASMLVVEDDDPWWASLAEVPLMVQRVGAGSGRQSDDAKLAYERQRVPLKAQGSTTRLLVQGLDAPMELEGCSGLARWRVVNAGVDGALVLRLTGGEACQGWLVARDGVYMKQAWEMRGVAVVLPPGGRADLVVQGGCALESRGREVLGEHTRVIEAVLARCPRGTRGRGGASLPSLPRLPAWLDEDLALAPLAEPPRLVEWTRAREGQWQVDHRAFERHEARFTLKLGQVVEWIVSGRGLTEAHPFHMHTNHFQVVDGSATRDWRDVVYVPPNGTLRVRFRPLHFTGTTVMHCHDLFHADAGMQLGFQIT